jgi:hypothetical protein
MKVAAFFAALFYDYDAIYRRMVEWQINFEIRKDLEGSGRRLLEELSWYSPGGTEERHEDRQAG